MQAACRQVRRQEEAKRGVSQSARATLGSGVTVVPMARSQVRTCNGLNPDAGARCRGYGRRRAGRRSAVCVGSRERALTTPWRSFDSMRTRNVRRSTATWISHGDATGNPSAHPGLVARSGSGRWPPPSAAGHASSRAVSRARDGVDPLPIARCNAASLAVGSARHSRVRQAAPTRVTSLHASVSPLQENTHALCRLPPRPRRAFSRRGSDAPMIPTSRRLRCLNSEPPVVPHSCLPF